LRLATTPARRKQVIRIARDIGFDAVDAGPLQNARLLEPLGYFNIQLGYALGLERRSVSSWFTHKGSTRSARAALRDKHKLGEAPRLSS
jgi:hypothetical protein